MKKIKRKKITVKSKNKGRKKSNKSKETKVAKLIKLAQARHRKRIRGKKSRLKKRK